MLTTGILRNTWTRVWADKITTQALASRQGIVFADQSQAMDAVGDALVKAAQALSENERACVVEGFRRALSRQSLSGRHVIDFIVPPKHPGTMLPVMAEISTQSQALINELISSVGQLDVLLLLRLRPEQWWTPASLNQELRLSESWIANVLPDLCARGFCEQTSDPAMQFRYRPKSPELAQAVDALAQDYLVHRVSLINAIYCKPAAPIQAFVDSFDLRKGKEHG